MRFGRLSTANDEEAGHKALPIRLPLMKRNRQSAQDAKENIPPEHEDGHDKVLSPSTKASRRKTVIDFFKHKNEEPKATAESDNILTRMSTERTKSVSGLSQDMSSSSAVS